MDFTHLVQARATLIHDGEDWCQKGNFVSLCCDMPAPNVSRPGALDRLTLATRSIVQNQWNMLTVTERLDWMRAQADTDEHIGSRWYCYASADIEFWHVNFRSLLDQVGLMVSELANAKCQVAGDSFRKLYDSSARRSSVHGRENALYKSWDQTGYPCCRPRHGSPISPRFGNRWCITAGTRWCSQTRQREYCFKCMEVRIGTS
jgi:hypothetical protein